MDLSAIRYFWILILLLRWGSVLYRWVKYTYNTEKSRYVTLLE